MKVTVELDTENPAHRKILEDFLMKYDRDAVMAGPVAEPSPTPAPEPAPPAAETPPAPTPPAPAPEPASPLTPVSNIRDQCNNVFAQLYVKQPQEAKQITELARKEFGPDSNDWTEDQHKQVLTRLEAALRF